jgi:hypothetical protein
MYKRQEGSSGALLGPAILYLGLRLVSNTRCPQLVSATTPPPKMFLASHELSQVVVGEGTPKRIPDQEGTLFDTWIERGGPRCWAIVHFLKPIPRARWRCRVS